MCPIPTNFLISISKQLKQFLLQKRVYVWNAYYSKDFKIGFTNIRRSFVVDTYFCPRNECDNDGFTMSKESCDERQQSTVFLTKFPSCLDVVLYWTHGALVYFYNIDFEINQLIYSIIATFLFFYRVKID